MTCVATRGEDGAYLRGETSCPVLMRMSCNGHCLRQRGFLGNHERVLINPGTNQFDLTCRKRIGAHGHPGLFSDTQQALNQGALLTVAGNDNPAGFPALHRGYFAVQAQPALRLLAAVAGDAALLKDGGDVVREGDLGKRFMGSDLGLGSDSRRACCQSHEKKTEATRQQRKLDPWAPGL